MRFALCLITYPSPMPYALCPSLQPQAVVRREILPLTSPEKFVKWYLLKTQKAQLSKMNFNITLKIEMNTRMRRRRNRQAAGCFLSCL